MVLYSLTLVRASEANIMSILGCMLTAIQKQCCESDQSGATHNAADSRRQVIRTLTPFLPRANILEIHRINIFQRKTLYFTFHFKL